jgi:hypothetical protein
MPRQWERRLDRRHEEPEGRWSRATSRRGKRWPPEPTLFPIEIGLTSQRRIVSPWPLRTNVPGRIRTCSLRLRSRPGEDRRLLHKSHSGKTLRPNRKQCPATQFSRILASFDGFTRSSRTVFGRRSIRFLRSGLPPRYVRRFHRGEESKLPSIWIGIAEVDPVTGLRST